MRRVGNESLPRYNVCVQGTIPSLIDGDSSRIAIFETLREYLSTLGPFQIEEKKSSLHLKNARAAFIGVHPRRTGLRLNLVLAERLGSPRVVKSEQVSANRWHNEIDVKQSADIDAELMDWIRKAYQR